MIALVLLSHVIWWNFTDVSDARLLNVGKRLPHYMAQRSRRYTLHTVQTRRRENLNLAKFILTTTARSYYGHISQAAWRG
jgi:hypothetical protein